MNESRIEKKFVLGKYKEDFLTRFLLINGFTKHFDNRIINSIYLDTISYDFAKDNINGVSERKKIRLRWYDDNLNKIFIEQKNKKNFKVWKNIEEIEPLNIKKNLIKNLEDYFKNNYFNKLANFNYNFVLKTNYKRGYWISDDKNIRATIDTDINASSCKDMKNVINLSETILEFKFSPKYENYFRSFFNNKSYQLRGKKYSKYIRSFTALENSGMIY
tara:strand:+ start:3622 stop:4275 length:654 start_codon:yes stop_codon:yes gene_type:complete